MAKTLRVMSESDENYVTVPVREISSADEVLRIATVKLDAKGSTSLFLRLKNSDSLLRERKLQGFESVLAAMGPEPEQVELVLRSQSPAASFSDDSSLVEVAHIGSAIREGVLKVRSKTAWKDRYCLLDSQCIYFAKSQKALHKEFTRIKLDTSKVRAGDELKNGKNSFELVTPHKVYVLRGNNAEDRTKWLQSISKQSSAYLEKKAFSTLNDEIGNFERRAAEADARLVSCQEDVRNLLKISEFVYSPSRDLLASYLPAELQQALKSLREIEDSVGKNPSALVKACSDLARVSLASERWSRIVAFLHQGLQLASSLTPGSSRAQQLRVKPHFDAALQQVYDLIATDYFPALKSNEDFLQRVMCVPGDHLCARVLRSHEREMQMLEHTMQ